MSDRQQLLTEDQLQKLVAFFELLAEIDAMPDEPTTSNIQEPKPCATIQPQE